MPNWCENVWEFYGTTADLVKIMDALNPGAMLEREDGERTPPVVTLDRIVPVPAEEDTVEGRNLLHGTKGIMFGTDSSAGSLSLTPDRCQAGKGVLNAVFFTAWGPPEPVAEKIRKDYPDVECAFFYQEPSMQISGWL